MRAFKFWEGFFNYKHANYSLNPNNNKLCDVVNEQFTAK